MGDRREDSGANDYLEERQSLTHYRSEGGTYPRVRYGRETFRDPAAKIVAPGGQVFFVVEDGKVLGTCAVILHEPEVHEIAKMAVAPEARGRGYGDLLMEAAVEFSRRTGARRVVIVSNTRLAPAIRLYEKHGFVRVPLAPDERYIRADIRLERTIRTIGR